MDPTAALARRRWLGLAATAAVPVALVVGFGHRGSHLVRNLLVPGAGVVDGHRAIAALFVAAAIVASLAWLRWGLDWFLAAVTAGSLVATVALVPGSAAAASLTPAASVASLHSVVRAAHEFPLVMLVAGALGWLRALTLRVPGVRRLRRRIRPPRRGLEDLAALPIVARCRAAAIVGLIERDDEPTSELARAAIRRDDVARRARRVGVAARFRVGGDPFRRDHAPARAARIVCGLATPDEIERFVVDCERALAGVPCSEPTWVRPLDATLAALALQRVAPSSMALARFEALIRGDLGVRRGRGSRPGHRPAWYWTPLGIAAGSAPAWEHAACSALAHWAGWVGERDWAALRARSLGAAARGATDPEDERLVAAARLWLCFVDDPEAHGIVHRPGVRRDPLACALDSLARDVHQHRRCAA